MSEQSRHDAEQQPRVAQGASSPPEPGELPRAETDLADPAARRLTAMALGFWGAALLAHLAWQMRQPRQPRHVPMAD